MSANATWWHTAAAALVIATVIAIGRPDLVAVQPAEFVQDHALLSMDIAINRALCDSPTKISTTVRMPYEARDHAALRAEPIRDYITGRAGTLEKYCLSVGSPVVNNENSLMWLESWIIGLRPGQSLDTVGASLHWIRLTCLATVLMALLRCGAGAAVSGVVIFCALVMLRQTSVLGITAYPLDFVTILLTAALWSLVTAGGWMNGRRGAVTVMLVMGALAAFGANNRTSHLAVFVAFTAIVIALDVRRSAALPTRARAARFAILVVAFTLGYAGFQRLAITRHLPRDIIASPNHTTWHSTVIGLAVPENDLSRREHIQWNDASAWDVARRTNPNVSYLSEEYESILFNYYIKLWREQPAAMVAVYGLKARTSGKQMIEVLRGSHERDTWWMWWLLRPADWAPDGRFLLAGYVLIAALAFRSAWRGSTAGLLATLVSTGAVLLCLESWLITSLYVQQYHMYLAFFLLAVSASVPVVAVGAAWRLARGSAVTRQ